MQIVKNHTNCRQIKKLEKSVAVMTNTSIKFHLLIQLIHAQKDLKLTCYRLHGDNSLPKNNNNNKIAWW